MLKNSVNRARRRLSSKLIKGQKRGGPVYSGTRKNPKHSRKLFSVIKLVAPAIITLANNKYHSQIVKFIGELGLAIKRAAQSDTIINICFRNTRSIHASGGIYLLASTDVLVRQYPGVMFSVGYPPKIPHQELKASKAIVHDVLCHIGFYKLLKKSPQKSTGLPHVDCWTVRTAQQVESEELGEAIGQLEDFGVDVTLLYRAGIEAMSNAAEHAYSDAVPTKRIFREKRWWLFTAILNNELIVYICDLGHGIPNTLPFTQNQSVLAAAIKKLQSFLPENVKKMIGHLDSDALQIAVSTLIKETRTSLDYRGKGGKDIKSFIDSNPSAEVQIYSNKGYWEYKNKQVAKSSPEIGIGYDNKFSIGGTIVGWSVPLKAKA